MADESLLTKLVGSIKSFLGVDQSNPEMLSAMEKASEYVVPRTPWRMYLKSWVQGGKKEYIAWSVNPVSVQWDVALRASHQKNLYGTVMHVWYDDSRNTFFDEIRLSIRFNSGSIMPTWIGGTVPRRSTPADDLYQKTLQKPVSIIGGGPGKGALGKLYKDFKGSINDTATSISAANKYPTSEVYTAEFKESHGLVNFYDFLNLVDAAKMTETGELNYVVIEYHSNLFPNLILKGLFDPSGVKFTDNAENPNEVESWTADFIVYDSAPRLTSSALDALQKENSALLNSYKETRLPKSGFGFGSTGSLFK